jgi:hypothetical protein
VIGVLVVGGAAAAVVFLKKGGSAEGDSKQAESASPVSPAASTP